VRARDGGEISLPSWEAAMAEDWLGKWALNLMLINVSTRKIGRAVRPPDSDVPAQAGAGLSKSAASRRFVALSAERTKEWMTSDLSKLDLLVIQIDGIHIADDLVLLAAVGVDGAAVKHPLGVIEGATENAVVVQALFDNLIERGLDPTICRLFIIDGAKALSKAFARPWAVTPRSSAARSTRPATSSSVCPGRCMPLCVRRCVRRGNWMTPTRPNGSSGTSPAGWSSRLPASPPASWRASTKSSPSSASAFPPSCADCWLALTLLRT
jgi:hypothetical protein